MLFRSTIKVKSFTGDMSITKLKDGQTISLSYTAQSGKLRVKYKLGSKDKWLEMKTGEEIELLLPCGQEGELKLLTTSVAATEQSLTTKIVRKDKKKCNTSCGERPPLSLFAPKAAAKAKRFIQGDSRFGPLRHVAAAIEPPNIETQTGEDLSPDELPVEDDGAEEEEDEENDDCEEPDNCLIGSWLLNLEQQEALLKGALVIPDVPEVQISNVDLTGSSVMSISDAWVGNWTWDAVSMAFDINTLDLGAQHTKAVIIGDMSFRVVRTSNPTESGGVIVRKRCGWRRRTRGVYHASHYRGRDGGEL